MTVYYLKQIPTGLVNISVFGQFDLKMAKSIS